MAPRRRAGRIHRQFTVRQHIFVPLDKPAVIMLLEVDAIRPMDIIARFSPDIHFAWPAALGGQYLVWEQTARAFLFSKGKQSVNAFLGSPAVTQASDVLAHMLAAAPPQLVLGVGNANDRDSALALFRELSAPGAAEREWKKRVAHQDSLISTGLRVRSPDTLLNRAVEYAKINLDESFVCNPDLGCGLSGAASDRPGFGWFYDGDAGD